MFYVKINLKYKGIKTNVQQGFLFSFFLKKKVFMSTRKWSTEKTLLRLPSNRSTF